MILFESIYKIDETDYDPERIVKCRCGLLHKTVISTALIFTWDSICNKRMLIFVFILLAWQQLGEMVRQCLSIQVLFYTRGPIHEKLYAVIINDKNSCGILHT